MQAYVKIKGLSTYLVLPEYRCLVHDRFGKRLFIAGTDEKFIRKIYAGQRLSYQKTHVPDELAKEFIQIGKLLWHMPTPQSNNQPERYAILEQCREKASALFKVARARVDQ